PRRRVVVDPVADDPRPRRPVERDAVPDRAADVVVLDRDPPGIELRQDAGTPAGGDRGVPDRDVASGADDDGAVGEIRAPGKRLVTVPATSDDAEVLDRDVRRRASRSPLLRIADDDDGTLRAVCEPEDGGGTLSPDDDPVAG